MNEVNEAVNHKKTHNDENLKAGFFSSLMRQIVR